MSKLIYSPTSNQLELTYQHVKESDQLTNGAYFSVAFTGDGYLYTHGKKFRLFKVVNDEISGISFSVVNGTAEVTIDGTSMGSGTVVQSVSGDTIVNATTTNGAVALTHKQYLNLNSATLYGGNLKVPIITVDKYGHITAVSEGTSIDVTKVKANTTTDTGTWYLTGVSGNTLQNPIYNTNIYFDKNGTLYAKDVTINGTAISNIFAPASHTSVGATDSVLGHVKLSDDYAQNPAANTAASPKAVYKALADSKAYADELVQAQDSMIFVGTINHQGVIKAHNDKVLTAVDDTTNISDTPYKVGWTFRFTSAGTFLGEAVEIGDIIIAVKDKASAFAISDWTIIQTNIDGSLTSSSNLSGVLYANNSRSISALAFSSGVLTSNGSAISFVNANTLWRTIKIDSTSIGTNALDLKHGTYTTLTNTNGAVVIEAKAADIIGTTLKLTIKKSTTSFEYKPNAAATLNIGDKLSLTESNGTYTLSHAAGTTITSKLGKITTDAYGHVTGVEEITTLPNAYKFIVKDASSNFIEYDGSGSNKTLKIINGTDISLTLSTSNGEVVLTPSITHKYRPVQYYATSSAENATSVLANNVNTALTLIGGTNVTLSSGSATGSIVISAEDTWRDIQAYKFTSNVLSRSSISGALNFGSDFLFEDNEVGLCWTEIDAEGRVTYVK